ncbi:hypothetical protein Ple7327_3523 [Pleurocapsa sp. PCC 7327]|nr:hypothetical protein Ple7327_3523 [Pleurocapsa sp. PCC 7327]
MSFSDLVEAIKKLSIEEKQEIQLLLRQYLREERREEIYNNFRMSQAEEQKGNLKFSSDINELRQLMEEQRSRLVLALPFVVLSKSELRQMRT